MAYKAKKRGGKKTTNKRRRSSKRGRVGSIGAIGVGLERIAAFIGGGLASQAVNGFTKDIPMLSKNPKILPAVKLGVGILGVMKSNSPMIQDAAAGMVTESGLGLARQLFPTVFNDLTGPGVGATLIDLNDISGGEWVYGEDHQVGNAEDYSVSAV